MSSAVVAVVIGVLVTAGLATIAWFFRQWANGVGDKVDELSGKVDNLGEKVGDQAVAIGQLQIAAGWPPSARMVRGG